MGTLVLPNLQGRQMGQVTVMRCDRSPWINTLVDTGVNLLCLPKALIEQLGLVQDGVTNVETTAGVQPGRIFRDVDLQIGNRRGKFDCLDLTEVDYPLLGVTPLEILGLEPDLQNRTLRFLPSTPEQMYLRVL